MDSLFISSINIRDKFVAHMAINKMSPQVGKYCPNIYAGSYIKYLFINLRLVGGKCLPVKDPRGYNVH